MRITQRELDRYRSQIASRQDDARAYVLARLQSEARGMTVAEAREASIGIMKDCLAVYGDQAQALSAELFDEICEAEGIDAEPGAMFDDVVDESRLSEKVHYYAGKLQDGDWDGYAGSNADLAAYYVHRSAPQNIVRNCRRNGAKLQQREDRVGSVAPSLRLRHRPWRKWRHEDRRIRPRWHEEPLGRYREAVRR